MQVDGAEIGLGSFITSNKAACSDCQPRGTVVPYWALLHGTSALVSWKSNCFCLPSPRGISPSQQLGSLPLSAQYTVYICVSTWNLKDKVVTQCLKPYRLRYPRARGAYTKVLSLTMAGNQTVIRMKRSGQENDPEGALQQTDDPTTALRFHTIKWGCDISW